MLFLLVLFANKSDGNGAKEQGTHVKPMLFVINHLLHKVEGRRITKPMPIATILREVALIYVCTHGTYR